MAVGERASKREGAKEGEPSSRRTTPQIRDRARTNKPLEKATHCSLFTVVVVVCCRCLLTAATRTASRSLARSFVHSDSDLAMASFLRLLGAPLLTRSVVTTAARTVVAAPASRSSTVFARSCQPSSPSSFAASTAQPVFAGRAFFATRSYYDGHSGDDGSGAIPVRCHQVAKACSLATSAAAAGVLARTHVLTLLALIRSASHSNSPTSKPPRCLRFERLARWS